LHFIRAEELFGRCLLQADPGEEENASQYTKHNKLLEVIGVSHDEKSGIDQKHDSDYGQESSEDLGYIHALNKNKFSLFGECAG
jgi:hypothetical protein